MIRPPRAKVGRLNTRSQTPCRPRTPESGMWLSVKKDSRMKRAGPISRKASHSAHPRREAVLVRAALHAVVALGRPAHSPGAGIGRRPCGGPAPRGPLAPAPPAPARPPDAFVAGPGVGAADPHHRRRLHPARLAGDAAPAA